MLKIFKALFRFFDVDDLAALIGTGLRIDPVRTLRLASVLIDVKLRSFQSVMGPALASARV